MNSANATEAPTSGVTEESLEKKISNPGLNEDETAFVNLVTQYYGTHGKVLTMAAAVTEYFFTEDEYCDLINGTFVMAALKERGIAFKPSDLQQVEAHLNLTKSDAVGDDKSAVEIVKPEDCSECGRPLPTADGPGDWRERSLSSLQIIVADTMLDLIDTRSQKKKLQDLGVSTTQYQRWLKDPTFSEYMRLNAKSMVAEQEHEAYLALLDKVRMGDNKALAMYLEMQGIYVPERGQNAGTNSLTDFKMLMIKILEIIQEEVPLEYQFNLGERIRGLVGIATTANDLVLSMEQEHEIHTPVVKPARQLSPRLQELMSKGVGSDD